MLQLFSLCAWLALGAVIFVAGFYFGVYGMMRAFRITMSDIRAYNARKRRENAQ